MDEPTREQLQRILERAGMTEPEPEPYEPTREQLQALEQTLSEMEAADPELAARGQAVNEAWDRLLKAEAARRRPKKS